VSVVKTLSLATLALSLAQAASADAKSQPESMAVTSNGTLLVGSASSPFVYRVRTGSAVAEKFIDASTEAPGTFFFGMLADAAGNTLGTCQLTPVPDTRPAQLAALATIEPCW
jgi:hypothetical protein